MFAVGMTTLTLFGYVIRIGSPAFWVVCALALVAGYAVPEAFCRLFYGGTSS